MKKMLIQKSNSKEKAKITGFRLYQMDITKLNEVSKKIGKNRSETIRHLINTSYDALFNEEFKRMNEITDELIKIIMKKAKDFKE